MIKWLLLVFLVAVAATAPLMVLSTEHVFFRAVTVLIDAVAAFAAFNAARAFGKGERMRLAWGALGAQLVLAGLTAGLFGPPFHSAMLPKTMAEVWIVAAFSIGLNGLSLLGVFVFARAWRAVGLIPPWHRKAIIISFATALAIGGGPAYFDLQQVLQQPLPPLAALSGDLGDIACVTILGPLIASVVWMRGGLLLVPFALLALNGVCWLCYDVGVYYWPSYSLAGDMFFASAAAALAGASAIAHRRLMR